MSATMPVVQSATRFRAAAAVAAAWLCLAAANAVHAEPTIERIEPPAGRSGTDVEVRIVGQQLDGAAELFFEEGRIRAEPPVVESGTVLKAVLHLPADCPPGPQRLRIRTSDGLSDLRMFHVHAAEQSQEVEPNDATAAAMPLEPGRVVWGTLKNEDVDLFRVRLSKGTRVAALIQAIRLDQQMLDAHLELVDAEGFVIASCDDHPLLAQDAVLAATAPADGDYFLRVRETAYGGGNAIYLLHVGDFPIPHVAWPPGGRINAPLDLEWLGDPTGPFRARVAPAPLELNGLVQVRPERGGIASPMRVPLRLTAADIVEVGEPNDQPEKAVATKAPIAIVGRIELEDDVDWIRVEAPKGSVWQVTGWGRRLGSPIDLVIAAHRDSPKRERITSNDDSDGPDSTLRVTVADETGFLLRVNDFERRHGDAFVYWIDVEAVEPRVTVSVPPAQTKTQQRLVAAVPRGNRTAVFFNAQRNDCSDPVRIECEGLPAGVSVATAPIVDPAPGGLVVFEAAADAAASTRAVGVQVLRSSGEANTPVGSMRQSYDMVFGDPNRTPFRTVLGDRLAVAVVEEAPATIELLEPRTPIPRRGTMDLAVKIRRAEGYNGRIRLEMPFKPPGIGATAVEAKEDASEATLPISCTAEAPTKQWSVAITATLLPEGEKKGEKKGGRRAARGSLVASRLVTLAVAEPLVEMTAEKAVVEQGHDTRIVFKATRPPSFTGTAKARLMGLPAKVESGVVDLAAGAESLEFQVRVAADAAPGKHETVFCRIEVPVGDAWMIHQTPATSLRIDKPLPEGVAAKSEAPR
jgi:hypothetical protein